MTPETAAIFRQAIEETNKKYALLEMEEEKEKLVNKGIRKGIKEGKQKEKEEIAKNLKKYHTPEEISEITGLPIEKIQKLK